MGYRGLVIRIEELIWPLNEADISFGFSFGNSSSDGCQFHKGDSCWFNFLDIRMTYDVKMRDGYVMESYNVWTTWTTWTTGSWQLDIRCFRS